MVLRTKQQMKTRFFKKIYEKSTGKVNFTLNKEGKSFSKKVCVIWARTAPPLPLPAQQVGDPLQTAEATNAGLPLPQLPARLSSRRSRTSAVLILPPAACH